MTLFNITPEHFTTADGRQVLFVDKDGFPYISTKMVTEDEKHLAAIALAIYENCLPLHASIKNVEVVTK